MRSPGSLALLLLAVPAAVAASGAQSPAGPVAADIEHLRADPDRFAKRDVVVAGKLDECSGWECSICPEAMTSATADRGKCLALNFRSVMPGTGLGEEAQEAVLRFSSVRMIARFDPACWRAPCTDRAPVLLGAGVVAVTRRRSSRDGLWLGPRTPIVPFTGASAAAAIAADADARYTPPQPNAIVIDMLPPGVPKKAVFHVADVRDEVFVCEPSSVPGTPLWPDSVEAAIEARSSMDFYRCGRVRLVNCRWVEQVGG